MRSLLLAVLAAVLSLQAQPKIQGFTLPNGLRVLLLEDHERPLVRARLHMRIEPGDTPQGRQGLPLLMVRMLGQAETADMKAEDLARILEESGIQLTHVLDHGGLSWHLVARSRDQDRAMGLLADRLLRSVLLPSVLASQRQACWRQEERQEDPPLVRLRLGLLRDPASRPTLKSLGAITLEDLLAFRAKVVRPDRAVLILHGDLGLEQTKRLVLLSLGSWTAQAPPSVASAVPIAAVPESPLTIPAPGLGLRVQAVASEPGSLSPEVAKLLGLLIPGDPDLRPGCVILDEGQLVATLEGEAGSTGSSAWTLLRGRLGALRSRGFTQADLDRARLACLAGRSLDSLHPEAEMDSALDEALGRGVSEDRMKGVTLDGLNAGLRNWLDPARFRIGAAGEPEALKSMLKP